MKRRDFIKGLGGLFLAPAIVKAENIMRINPVGVIMPDDITKLMADFDVTDYLFRNSAKIATQKVDSVQMYQTDFDDPAVLENQIITDKGNTKKREAIGSITMYESEFGQFYVKDNPFL